MPPTAKEDIKNNFPIKGRDGSIYYFVDIVEQGHCLSEYRVLCRDNFNYQYSLPLHVWNSVKKGRSVPNIFFKKNPNTEHNISIWLIDNSMPFRLNSKFSNEVNSITPVEWKIIASGNIFTASWNQVNRDKDLYLNTDLDSLAEKQRYLSMTKEQVASQILSLYRELGRPLYQDDFSPKRDDCVGIRLIEKYWGSLHVMQEALGLPLTGKYSGASMTFDECVKALHKVCDSVKKKQNRRVIMYSDINDYGGRHASTFSRLLKQRGKTIRDIVEEYGYKLQRCGRGYNHIFEDGERSWSKLEYDFSSFLRGRGLRFGTDYLKDVPYGSFCLECKENITCDYVLKLNDKLIYIEIAGLLAKKSEQDAFVEDIALKSKAKEKYRQTLKRKEKLFKDNQLTYRIVFDVEKLKDDFDELFI